MLEMKFSETLQKITKYFLVLLLFLLMSLIPCLVNNYLHLENTRREQQALSEKVHSIMKMYNCDNQEIFEAIMTTFDPLLVAVVIAVESEFRVDAVSHAGCRGLMQLSPDKLEDWKNIHQNIRIGSAYLETQLNRFGDLELAFAAYNAGPESVQKYQGVPPFRETIAYIKKAKRFGLLAFNDTTLNQESEIVGQKHVKALL